MKPKTTALAIAVLLGVYVLVLFVGYQSRRSFVTALVAAGVFLAVRLAISVRKSPADEPKSS